MKWEPSFRYTDEEEVDVALSLPVGLWNHQDKTIGGEAESDGAFPASFVVRRDYVLAIPLRLFESEWPVVRALVEFGQTGGVIRWFPSIDEETYFDVYLESPALGDDFRPIPDATYPRALLLSIAVRRVDGEAFPLEYFAS
jgi:hypothetical protein